MRLTHEQLAKYKREDINTDTIVTLEEALALKEEFESLVKDFAHMTTSFNKLHEMSDEYKKLTIESERINTESNKAYDKSRKIEDRVRNKFLKDGSYIPTYSVMRNNNIRGRVLDAIDKITPLSHLTNNLVEETVKKMIDLEMKTVQNEVNSLVHISTSLSNRAISLDKKRDELPFVKDSNKCNDIATFYRGVVEELTEHIQGLEYERELLEKSEKSEKHIEKRREYSQNAYEKMRKAKESSRKEIIKDETIAILNELVKQPKENWDNVVMIKRC